MPSDFKSLASAGFAILACVIHFYRIGEIKSAAASLSEAAAVGLEAPPGFEPGSQGFAGPCLTTWL